MACQTAEWLRCFPASIECVFVPMVHPRSSLPFSLQFSRKTLSGVPQTVQLHSHLCVILSNTHVDSLSQLQKSSSDCMASQRGPLCSSMFSTHTQHSERSRQHSSHTNIYPSFSLRCPPYCPARHRKGLLCMHVCVQVRPAPP